MTTTTLSTDILELLDLDMLHEGHEGSEEEPNKYVPILPPCEVCGEKSSGYHYGANTCEACKAFFRRCLKRKQQMFRCEGTGQCEKELGKSQLANCGFCRYKKCMELGMSRGAIRRGRYTLEKRTHNIQKVKMIEREERQQRLRMIDPHAYQRELQQLVQQVMVSDRAHNHLTPELFDKVPYLEAVYMEEIRLKEDTFGPLKPITREEYRQIWQSTGIDIDGRQEYLAKVQLPNMEMAINRFVAIVKGYPGFQKLPMEDQISLVKGGRFDHWFLSTFKCYNTEDRLYTTVFDGGRTVHISDMLKVAHFDTVDQLFKTADRIQKMHLSVDEITLLKALAFLSRDRCVTEKGAEQVEKMQWKLMESFQETIKSNHPDDPCLIAKLMVLLADLRSLDLVHRQEITDILAEYSTIPIPPAVYEAIVCP